MRIHVNRLESKRPIFGSLVFDLTEFKQCSVNDGKHFFIFDTKRHGLVTCQRDMAIRIKERLAANNQSTAVIDQALNDNCYKESTNMKNPNYKAPEGYYTEEEMANLIGKEISTLRTAHARRKDDVPPCTKLGQTKIYSKESFAKWLEQKEQKPIKRGR